MGNNSHEYKHNTCERTNVKIASVGIEKATVSTWRTKGVALVMVVVVFEGYRWGRGLGRTVGGRHRGKGDACANERH